SRRCPLGIIWECGANTPGNRCLFNSTAVPATVSGERDGHASPVQRRGSHWAVPCTTCLGRPTIERRPASQETCRRLVALALTQGMVEARCFPSERRTKWREPLCARQRETGVLPFSRAMPFVYPLPSAEARACSRRPEYART